MIVVGIKNLNNIPCKIFLLHCLLIIALIEGIKLEAFYSLRIPDTQCIHNSVAISHNGKVVGNSLYALISFLNEIASPVFVDTDIHITAEFHHLGILRSSKLKRIAVHKPVIRNLHLISVSDFLLEHTITISDSASVGRISQTA